MKKRNQNSYTGGGERKNRPCVRLDNATPTKAARRNPFQIKVEIDGRVTNETRTLCPPAHRIWRWAELIPDPMDVRVVIGGQDPHTRVTADGTPMADGLAFSVSREYYSRVKTLPPSLVNVLNTVRKVPVFRVTITAVMSSSDEDVGDDKYLDRALFVKLVTQHPVIIEKCKTPSAVKAKKDAWKIVSEDYSSATGKVVTVVQLNKLLSNMKSNIKIKTDKKQTGNKPIKMKSWETEFHDFLSQGNNPVFSKVPGSISIGTSSNPTTSATKTLAEVEQSDDENLSNEGTVCGGKKNCD
ncbi:hypothetical protein J6590_096367 [Homalodisca vitripennis]|nr:hypothetical protein J6590_096367 [Homalodisca vitripennis]